MMTYPALTPQMRSILVHGVLLAIVLVQFQNAASQFGQIALALAAP